ncbi:MAG: tetratricopeptide repeat protein [Prevotellaceae bacterium]|jgi:tetratricopeptide (TPR) repeat protein|nr:tetratricopeptide repeat protein [Prevotellaceae bacterium]
MKKIILATALFCALSVFGQSEINENEIKKNIASQALNIFTDQACECMDSISVSNKNMADVSQEISRCIDSVVIGFQMTDKLLSIDTTKQEDITMEINADPNSTEYRSYYHRIENILLADCAALQRLMGTSNRESEFSYSSNSQALNEYNEGMEFLEKQDYKAAVKHFEKAVKIDEKFAFAWDNIGMCYRRMDKYDKAIESYNKSLSIDPKGEMPLVNLPVVYELQKDYAKALDAYLKLQKIYPLNTEGFYGAGRILFLMEKYEEALPQMCTAFLLYVKQKSPYRADAEKIIGLIYQKMKEQGKENEFRKIMNDSKINFE